MTPEELDEWISSMMHAGYASASEIVQTIVESDELEEGAPGPSEIEALVHRKVAARREECAASSPSYDRLARAFAELASRDVLARENYWCCQTCAYSAIDREIAEGTAEGRTIRGYVLFHNQDTDRAVESGELPLRYGSVTADPQVEGEEATRKIGAEVVAALRAQAFDPQWSGSPEDIIRVPIAWDKLLPT